MELDQLTQNLEAVALEGLDHLDAYRPEPYKAPPAGLARAIDEARHQRAIGRMEGARRVYTDAVSHEPTLKELALYREYLTFAERENARRLSSGCWVLATLLPRAKEGDEPLTNKLAALRTQLIIDYGVAELSTDRGWAEGVCRQFDLLPPIWRHS